MQTRPIEGSGGARLGQRIFEYLLSIGTRSAKSIMARAHARRTGRTHDRTDQCCSNVKKVLVNQAPSTAGMDKSPEHLARGAMARKQDGYPRCYRIDAPSGLPRIDRKQRAWRREEIVSVIGRTTTNAMSFKLALAMNMIVARGGLLLEFSGRIELVLSAFLVTGDMVTNMNGPALNPHSPDDILFFATLTAIQI
jgi:hypothetical protein